MNEAFCKACERLEPLDDEGNIAQHTTWYSEYGRWHQVTCKGTGVEPEEEV